jgi:hypothetical protein
LHQVSSELINLHIISQQSLQFLRNHVHQRVITRKLLLRLSISVTIT